MGPLVVRLEGGLDALAALMATMTLGRWINFAAAAFGAIGAIVLFNGLFAARRRGEDVSDVILRIAVSERG
jgi:hypothetical protein